jgi:hypothetical protein
VRRGVWLGIGLLWVILAAVAPARTRAQAEGIEASGASAEAAPAAESAAPESPEEPSAPPETDGAATDAAESEEAETDAAETEEEEEEAEDDFLRFLRGFHFGSYGRVIGASDLAGRTGRQSRIVTFAPRIDEDDTYAEIELRREDSMFGVDTRIVATVAYAGPLFHYDGEFSERIAIRNLFAEARNILTPHLDIWGGSRMVRGDDVYLMNFWPMDNLNIVGGGMRYTIEDTVELALTVGMSQPNNPFQRQTDLFPARAGFLPDEVFILDRPRIIAALRAQWWFFGRESPTGAKALLYGEQHWLAGGERRRSDGSLETLPEDSGFVLGAQLGGYVSADHTFMNVFFRYARGLGAYDPLGVPFRTGTAVSTGRAEEIRLAVSANWEWRENPDIGVGVQLGAWWRLFHDADPAVFNRGTLSEGALSVRPMLWFGEVAGVALDASYQGMQSTAIDELTGRVEGGHVFKLGLMPFISPFGRGTYSRPQIRLLYVITGRDDGARRLYNDADPRSQATLEHFLGVSVEWWFSSSSYNP